MTFVSLTFALFFVAAFAVHWALPTRGFWRNAWLLLSSLVFYSCWDLRATALLAACTVFSYLAAFALTPGRRFRKLAFVSVVTVQLGVLAAFKYFGFFSDAAAALLSALGFAADLPTLRLILPVGVSFYTFMAIGYLADVYAGRMAPERDPLRFAAFMTFFPQLAAGPIGRAGEMLPQFAEPRAFDRAQAVDGCRQFLWGVFKKLAVADATGIVVNEVFARYVELSGAALAMGLVLFAIQIYADFSAYSDMAIGVGKLFGIRLRRNFDNPYFATNIADFWRRWHISLTSWFRDYVYIPLGGSRCSKARRIFNVLVVFSLSGLWHGANWTYVIWGVLHGLFFVPWIFLRRTAEPAKSAGVRARAVRILVASGAWCLTMVGVLLAWAFFRAPTASDALAYLGRLFAHGEGGVLGLYDTLAMAGIMFACEFVHRRRGHGLDLFIPWKVVRWLIYLTLLSLACYSYQASSPFLYFKF